MKFSVTILLCSSFLIQQCLTTQESNKKIHFNQKNSILNHLFILDEEIFCQQGITSAKQNKNCENSTNFSFKVIFLS